MRKKNKKPFQINNAKLHKIRRDAQISTKDFAEKVGKKSPHISNYETGVANPPANVLLGYLILCNVNPNDILLET
jgi:DNA-binding transcriptional regulator YiaG